MGLRQAKRTHKRLVDEVVVQAPRRLLWLVLAGGLLWGPGPAQAADPPKLVVCQSPLKDTCRPDRKAAAKIGLDGKPTDGDQNCNDILRSSEGNTCIDYYRNGNSCQKKDEFPPTRYCDDYWVNNVKDKFGECQQELSHDKDVDGPDLWGDACDNCPAKFNPGQEDQDQDCVGDVCDNCASVCNPDQKDTDRDGIGDACDTCPAVPNPGAAQAADRDGDGVPDACDDCPGNSDKDQADTDHDRVGDACDNCPTIFNPDQTPSTKYPGLGKACEPGIEGGGGCSVGRDPAGGTAAFTAALMLALAVLRRRRQAA